MSRIPFKVSARTALLLGRENVANAKGALIELVKNGYDADSPISLIYFDNKYADLPSTLDSQDLSHFISSGIDTTLLYEVYVDKSGQYNLKEEKPNKEKNPDIDAENLALKSIRNKFRKEINKLSAIYIVDFGEGMTKGIIENYWMTIGTDNKLSNMVTTKKRVKAGAKGIGRFALDRLGSRGEMTTFFNPLNRQISDEEKIINGYQWKVNWEDFEVPLKTIGDIGADLAPMENTNFLDLVKSSINIDISNVIDSIDETRFDKCFGTLLKISNLRDYWDNAAVRAVFSDLEVLVPPKEEDDFRVYLYSERQPESYGEVLSSVCDDYDYKLVAKADEEQNVKITVYRNEYDIESIPDGLFMRDAMSNSEKYHRKTFEEGSWVEETTFSRLLPGFSESDKEGHFKIIGPFEFSFYFMKRAATTPDATRFFYKRFMSNNRKDWLDKFGGIKLYRDNFRVRPYGETNDVAFDWLGLGNRKAASPAGVAKDTGGYRVEPENVAGAINISRLTNLNFEDKSSREGLQENNTFKVFKSLIAAIINKMEDDRSYIAREMAAFDDEQFGGQREMERAEKLAEDIANRARKNNNNKDSNASQENGDQDTSDDTQKNTEEELLALLIGVKNEKIERLEEEQKLLRGLASSGIVSASFGHDLSKLSDVLGSRVDKIIELIRVKVDETNYINVEDRKNPFEVLRRIKKQDLKIKNWLNFSLGFTRKDKRKREQLNLKNYFDQFKMDWDSALEDRLIKLHVDVPQDVVMRVFEIDFDSIFSNLLVNSIDAFLFSKTNDARQVYISCVADSKEISIEYRDTGPGLSKDIDNPEKIFQPLFTTKLNSSGDEIGTGLGMWIIKSVVEENDGTVKLLYPDNGFGLRMSFPHKYKAL
ncbi:MAG: HAMP domain-containing histidine kinase [Methylotenera sp.]|nr:HAMP domain-containing histidine kinase [Methylotenera sp.]